MHEDVSFGALSQLARGRLLDDRFQILDCLGQGAVGVVYRAVDRAFDRSHVAIKCIHPHLAQNTSVLERLKREVLLTRRLQHSNIIAISECYISENEAPVVVMELVDGCTLRDLIDGGKGRLTALPDRIELLRQIASALAYAHDAGVVHRDMKPANVLLTRDGDVKIADFGLARCIEDDLRLTKTGASMGTPHYMSPEQFRGQTAGTASDIYSFGILAYEMITGEKPFSDPVYFALALKHLTDPLPEPKDSDLEAFPWLVPLIQKCAAKSPDERFESMHEVAEILAEGSSRSSNITRTAAVRKTNLINRAFKTRTRLVSIAAAVLCIPALSVLLQLFALTVAQLSPDMRERVGAGVLMIEKKTLPIFPLACEPLKTLIGLNGLQIDRPHDIFVAIARWKHDAKDPGFGAMIYAGADLNARDENGNSPLRLVRGRDDSSTLRLIRHGADINAREPDGASTFMHLLDYPTLWPWIPELLPLVDFDLSGPGGMTALHQAIFSGNVTAVRAMLADPRAKGMLSKLAFEKYPPFFYSLVITGPSQEEIVRLFLLRGSVSSVLEDGRDALSIAALHSPPGVIRLLIERGARDTIGARSPDGKSVLDLLHERFPNPNAEEQALIDALHETHRG